MSKQINVASDKTPKRKVTFWNKLGYGVGNFIGGGALSISSAWLLFFYTTFCGLPVWQGTLIFTIGTYLDVVENPLMGFITDNFNNTRLGRKFGRRRFFILISIPLMLWYPLLWQTGHSFTYYLITYLVYEWCYTMFNIPYKTLPAEMTEDYTQRTSLSGFQSVFGKVAAFITSAIPGMFFVWLGKNNPRSYQMAVLSYAIMMALAALIVYLSTWELPVSEVKSEHVANFWEGFKKMFIDIFSTLRIRSFRWHLGMYCFGFGGEWLFAATNTYFFIFVLKQTNVFVSEINSINSILQLISTIFIMGVFAKVGQASKPYMAALETVIFSMLAWCSLWLFGLTQMTWLIFAISIVYGLGTGAVYYIPWANYVFMADVDEVVTNRRREGIYSGAQTMAGKLIRATIMLILGIVLSETGFVKGNATQPMSAQWGIVLILIVGVCGLEMLGIICSHHMHVTRDTVKICNDEVARRANGGRPEDVDPKTKQVLEDLTGFSYEECFGNNNVGYHEKGLETVNQNK